MIERVKTKKKEDIARFYDERYSKGGFFSEEGFNKRALNILDIKKNETMKLLDIACGQGTLLALAENYVETYGVDISKEAIKKARKIAKNTVFKISSAEKLPFKNSFFDYMTCMGSLEHFPNMDTALKEMNRVIKPNGKILIHVPNSLYLIHKILGIDTQGQINERLATEKEWKDVLEKQFVVDKTKKYNTRWYFYWIPKKYCCHFTFLCRKR